MENIKMVLNKRPIGFPTADVWRYDTEAIPTIGEGQILIRVDYVSLDPAMRGWINEGRSYIPPVGIDEVMRAGGVGEVLESKNPKFQKGDTVHGMTGIQQYCITDGRGYIKIDTTHIPAEKYLGVLGMPGFTAYFGLLDIGMPHNGETVVVSGAAGAVGSIVGQIAKLKGCHVVGIAGGGDKCAYVVNDLGFDACIDYKSEDVRVGLKQHCPRGIDVYFDNVGGDILDIVLTRINMKARIVICGAISQYNSTTPVKGPSNYLSLLVNSARMEGFVVFHFAHRYPEAATQMAQWMKEGKIKSREHIDMGIDNFYSSFNRLFSGDKEGKLVLKISD